MLQRLRDKRLAVFTIRVSGVITSKTLTQVNGQLSKLGLYKPAALAVIVNSPGGAAASSHLLTQRLLAYAQVHQVPLYGFAEALAASGGYMVLSACREIYVSPGSLIGNIGTRFDLMSLRQLALKYGVERRVWAATPLDLKARIDLLTDASPDTKKWLNAMLEESHEDFKRDVQVARGSRLAATKGDEPALNGEVYVGEKAIEAGLADKVGSADQVLKEIFPALPIIDLSRRSQWAWARDSLRSALGN